MCLIIFYCYKPIGAAPRGHFFCGGGGGVWAKKVVTVGYGFPIRKKSSASRQYCKCILIESKLCTIQYCNITIPYCNIPYCRIRRDAPPITATPSSLPKRRRRIPTIVPLYRPILHRHQLIVESSGPLVSVVVPPVALLPLVVIIPPVKVVVHSVALLPLAAVVPRHPAACRRRVPPVAIVVPPPLVAVVLPHVALTSAAARRPPLLVADC